MAMLSKPVLRTPLLLALAALATLAAPGTTRGEWPADPTVNVAISRLNYREEHTIAVSDGADGAIVIWQDFYGSYWGYDLTAQRVAAHGALQWPGGVIISDELRDQRDQKAVSDGAGGAIIVWCDLRSAGDSGDIYAQRVDAAGTTLWTTDGVAICTAADVQAYPQLVADDAGGAIITWRDSRLYPWTGADIYAQRVNALGVPQWTPGGVPVCTVTWNQMDPAITTDGAGGAIIAWMDGRDVESGTNVYLQRVNAAGAPQWAADGVGYLAYGNQEWLAGNSPLVSDGAGGAIVAWQEDYYGPDDHDIRALRIDASGSFPWSPANRWICGASGNQWLRGCAGDDMGNMVITWRDDRYGLPDTDVFAQLLDAAGNQHWPGSWGAGVCTTADPQEDPKVVMDEAGGAVITWTDQRSGSDIYAQRMSAAGDRTWSWNGVAVCSESHVQHSPALAKAGACGAVIAWTDYRWDGVPGQDTDWDIYGQRVYCDGSLSQFITLDVPNGGESWRVGTTHDIVWHAQGITNRDVMIEYSTDNGGHYSFVAYVTQIGTVGSFSWEVPNTPAERCRVRVSVWSPPEVMVIDASDGSFTITPATSVEDRPVPAALVVDPARPNPSRGMVTLTLGLPGPMPLSLKVYDASGRLVKVVADGIQRAGWRDLRWDATSAGGKRVAPGVYYFALRAGDKALTEPVVVVR